jgi:hypothetical protein
MSDSIQAQMIAERGDSTARHAGYVSVAEIAIAAPAKAIWPHVLDIGSWVYDFHFEHISGQRGGEGEVKYLWAVAAEGVNAIAEKDRTLENAIVLKTLSIIPQRLWYGINPPRLEGESLGTGVNMVMLSEQGNQTRVTAIRSKESLCPNKAARDTTQDKMIKYQPIAQSRWTDKYLPRLKELSERTR